MIGVISVLNADVYSGCVGFFFFTFLFDFVWSRYYSDTEVTRGKWCFKMLSRNQKH